MKIQRRARIWHEPDSTIIKLMPSACHDVTVGQFSSYIIAQIFSMPNHGTDPIWSLTTSRFVSNGRSKEADSSFVCPTRPPTAWPNVVIEVGYSESIQLRMDAQWWLAAGQGVRLVLFVNIQKRVQQSPASMRLEVWKMVAYTGKVTSARRQEIPACTDSLDVSENLTTTPPNTEIVLPYNCFFDVVNP
jgi:hypothetical protein